MPRLMLGLGDLAVSAERGDTLVTTGLGSCVAVVVVDRGVSGVAHIVVPHAPPAANAVPKVAYYAPTGVTALLSAARQLGARLGAGAQVALVGGAAVVDGLTSFDIGRRNLLAVRRALWMAGIAPSVEEVDGTDSRSVSVDAHTGEVRVRTPSQGEWTLISRSGG